MPVKVTINNFIVGVSVLVAMSLTLWAVQKDKPVLKKSLVACFIDGETIFAGEIIGDTNIGPDGKISFYSPDLNTQVHLLNASCMVMDHP